MAVESHGRRGRLGASAAITVLVVIAVVFVASTLQRPAVPTYAPSPVEPREAGEVLVGPRLHTVDATAPDRWRYFSFRLGSVVEDPGPRDWDLAFRRFHVIANGGSAFAGKAGVRDLGPVPFESVERVPDDGYTATTGGGEPTNPAIARWYDYGFFSHVLTPKPHVWAIRTADGRYAKLEIVGYYCDSGQPGCVTFRYVYQGDGSTTMTSRPG